MIPSLDAHKVCRVRNTTRTHIRLKPSNKTFILFALIALLSMSAVVKAQDEDYENYPEGGATTSGGTTQIKTTSTTGTPYQKG